MSFCLGILGGSLQGLEVAALSLLAGFETVLVDGNANAPAAEVASRFVHRKVSSLKDLDQAFKGCDLVIPANENLSTLELLDEWERHGTAKIAFSLPSFRISRDKLKSKELFSKVGALTPKAYPDAGFPLIAKPNDQSGSSGVKLIASADELEEHLKGEKNQKLVLEEYLAGPSYSLEIVGSPGNYRTFTVTELMMDRSYDCRGVRSPAKISSHLENTLSMMTLDIATALNLEGIMDIEVISTEKGLFVLEIDARFPSQTPLAVYLSSGENLLWHLCKTFVGVPPKTTKIESEALLEHISVQDKTISLVGEHRISLAHNLRYTTDFFGADAAITDMHRNFKSFCATIMLCAASVEELAKKRADLYEKLGHHLKAETGFLELI